MKYYYTSGSNKIDCTDKLKKGSGYFLGGYQDEKEAGLLYIMVWDNGTCLTPVFDQAGNMIRKPEYAGKDLKETSFKI